MKKFYLLLSFLFPTLSLAQSTAPDAIERVTQNADFNLSDFQKINTFFENVDDYQRQPLALNTANYEDLATLPYLNAQQINAFLAYRQQYGKLRSVYELQAVPHFSPDLIRSLLPLVSINDSLHLAKIDSKVGRNELFGRWGKVLEEEKGFIPNLKTQKAPFQGNGDYLYARFRHTNGSRLSYGITLEKDRGEPSEYGFWSGHYFQKNLTKRIKTIALGDFSVSLGQGLILDNQFFLGKTGLMNVERFNPILNRYTSSSEGNFLRGIGFTYQWNRYFQTTFFASHRLRGANLYAIDTFSNKAVSSFSPTGLYRSESEIQDFQAVAHTHIGTSARYQKGQGHLAFNQLFQTFSLPILPKAQPYNRFYFRGKNLWNSSIDYAFQYQNYRFFGETALILDSSAAMANLHGVSISMRKSSAFSLLFRHFDKDFHAFGSSPFAENSQPQNEKGLYLGFEHSFRYFKKNWQLSAYYDVWQHPYWRFGVDAPSKGEELFLRFSNTQRLKQTYFQFRYKMKEENLPLPPKSQEKIHPLAARHRFSLRLQHNQNWNKSWETRSRLEVSQYSVDTIHDPKRQGIMLSQDFFYHRKSWKTNGRLAWFNTADYQTAIFAYENALLYAFSVQPYFYKGFRWYWNIDWQLSKKYSLEARIAQTRLTNRELISSGNTQINQSHRTEIGLQLRYQW